MHLHDMKQPICQELSHINHGEVVNRHSDAQQIQKLTVFGEKARDVRILARAASSTARCRVCIAGEPFCGLAWSRRLAKDLHTTDNNTRPLRVTIDVKSIRDVVQTTLSMHVP